MARSSASRRCSSRAGAWCLLALLSLAPLLARAEGEGTSQPPEIQPTEIEEAKEKEEKQERQNDFAILPGLNYSTEAGLGFGLNAAIFVRDVGFKPYRYAAKLTLFATTRRVQDHSLTFDAPSINHSPYRPQLAFGFFRDPIRPFFGIGNTVEAPTGSPGEERQYELTSIYFTAALERRLWGGPWKLSFLYDLRSLNMTVKPNTLLAQQRPAGSGGGGSGRLDVELLYDTRDVEASPTRGYYVAVTAYTANPLLGSTFTYGGMTVEGRGFFSPGVKAPWLVLAARLMGDVNGGDVPVALLPVMGGRSRVEGIGGSVSVRGLPRYRYIGKAKVLGNLEARSRFARFKFWNRPLDLWGAAFVDSGRVWAELKSDGPFWNFHTGFGAGARIAWAEDFVVRLDVARAEGNTGFYAVLDQMF